MENDCHHLWINNLTKNVTENRASRRKTSKQQRDVNIDVGKKTVCDKKLLTYANGLKETTENVVDLSQIYSDLLAIENSSPSKMNEYLPDLCTKSEDIPGDPGSPNRKRN